MHPIFILTPDSSSVGVVPEIELSQGMVVRVGRISSNDYALPQDFLMSSEHFEAHGEIGGCRIVDLESSNGLFVNEERVSQALAIEGDRIRAGNTIWTVVRRGGNEPQTADVWVPSAAIHDQPVGSVGNSQNDVASTTGQVDDPGSSLLLASNTGEKRSLERGERLTIGRTDLAQWVFGQDAQMSSLHFEVFDRDGSWWAKDLQSTNGLYVNEDIVDERTLAGGDEIRSGQTTFKVEVFGTKAQGEQSSVAFDFPSQAPQPTASAIAASTPITAEPAPQIDTTACLRRLADSHEFQLERDRSTIVGRSLEADISLHTDTQVSTQHASLLFDGQVINVKDLGSSNGTFVNNQRISSGQIAEGDQIRFGQTVLEVQIRHSQSAENPAMRRVPSSKNDTQELAYAPPVLGEHQASQDLDSPTVRTGDASPDDLSSKAKKVSEQIPDDKRIESDLEDAGPPANVDVIPYFTEEDFRSQGKNSKSGASTQAGKSGGNERPEIEDEKQVEVLREFEMASGRQPATPGEHFEEERTSTDAKAEDENQKITIAAPIRVHQQVAGNSIDYQTFICGSGLVLYRGVSPKFDPLDVALRLLQATQGWVLDGAQVENWLQNFRSGGEQRNEEWLQAASASDASWMLPFSDSWGSDQAWLIFARGESELVKKAIINLQIGQNGSKVLRPKAISEFLANHCGGTVVERFFAPLDAILLEVHAGERWALFGRAELEPCLRDLRFVPRSQW